jgi:predicted dehydrogenase
MGDAVGPVGVVVVGCGAISSQYLRGLRSFRDTRVLFCADLDTERAKAQAVRFAVPAAGSLEQALETRGVEIVVNLTGPATHAEVAAAAIAAGKSVWIEKPLALDVSSGRALLAAAERAGVRIGCAPDTILAPAVQTARRLIEAGTIGVPQTALAVMQDPGPEHWHPHPEFLFQHGAGPLFDIGPYYMSVLAALFGPAGRVAAIGRRARESRVIGSGPAAGTAFPVEVPSYVAALVQYAHGQAASLVFSFDSPQQRHGFVEISGTEAALALPGPDSYTGDVQLREPGADGWTVIPATGPRVGRGIGVLEMARALRSGAPFHASGEFALHILEMMEAVGRSIDAGSFEQVFSTFDLPKLMDSDWDPLAATLGP